jgi:hypothetical protein
MSGRLPRGDGETGDEAPNRMLARIAEAVHRVREEYAAASGIEAPEFEDTRYFVLMMAYSLFAEALAGDLLTESAGLEANDEGRHAFRRWLAERSQEMILPGSTSAVDPDA